jgi:hypothetical protein
MQLLDEAGNQVLRTIVDNVEQHMEWIGFKHGVYVTTKASCLTTPARETPIFTKLR